MFYRYFTSKISRHEELFNHLAFEAPDHLVVVAKKQISVILYNKYDI